MANIGSVFALAVACAHVVSALTGGAHATGNPRDIFRPGKDDPWIVTRVHGKNTIRKMLEQFHTPGLKKRRHAGDLNGNVTLLSKASQNQTDVPKLSIAKGLSKVAVVHFEAAVADAIEQAEANATAALEASSESVLPVEDVSQLVEAQLITSENGYAVRSKRDNATINFHAVFLPEQLSTQVEGDDVVSNGGSTDVSHFPADALSIEDVESESDTADSVSAEDGGGEPSLRSLAGTEKGDVELSSSDDEPAGVKKDVEEKALDDASLSAPQGSTAQSQRKTRSAMDDLGVPSVAPENTNVVEIVDNKMQMMRSGATKHQHGTGTEDIENEALADVPSRTRGNDDEPVRASSESDTKGRVEVGRLEFLSHISDAVDGDAGAPGQVADDIVRDAGSDGTDVSSTLTGLPQDLAEHPADLTSIAEGVESEFSWNQSQYNHSMQILEQGNRTSEVTEEWSMQEMQSMFDEDPKDDSPFEVANQFPSMVEDLNAKLLASQKTSNVASEEGADFAKDKLALQHRNISDVHHAILSQEDVVSDVDKRISAKIARTDAIKIKDDATSSQPRVKKPPLELTFLSAKSTARLGSDRSWVNATDAALQTNLNSSSNVLVRDKANVSAAATGVNTDDVASDDAGDSLGNSPGDGENRKVMPIDDNAADAAASAYSIKGFLASLGGPFGTSDVAGAVAKADNFRVIDGSAIVPEEKASVNASNVAAHEDRKSKRSTSSMIAQNRSTDARIGHTQVILGTNETAAGMVLKELEADAYEEDDPSLAADLKAFTNRLKATFTSGRNSAKRSTSGSGDHSSADADSIQRTNMRPQRNIEHRVRKQKLKLRHSNETELPGRIDSRGNGTTAQEPESAASSRLSPAIQPNGTAVLHANDTRIRSGQNKIVFNVSKETLVSGTNASAHSHRKSADDRQWRRDEQKAKVTQEQKARQQAKERQEQREDHDEGQTDGKASQGTERQGQDANEGKRADQELEHDQHKHLGEHPAEEDGEQRVKDISNDESHDGQLKQPEGERRSRQMAHAGDSSSVQPIGKHQQLRHAGHPKRQGRINAAAQNRKDATADPAAKWSELISGRGAFNLTEPDGQTRPVREFEAFASKDSSSQPEPDVKPSRTPPAEEEEVDISALGSLEQGLNGDAASSGQVHPYLGFKHMPQGGGAFMVSLMSNMTKHLPQIFDGSFVMTLDESMPVVRKPRGQKDTFMISTVENPCNWYVDLWATSAFPDASTLHGMYGGPNDPEPFFDLHNSNASKFANWLQWAQGRWNTNTTSNIGDTGDVASAANAASSVMSPMYWEAFVSKQPARDHSSKALDQYAKFFSSNLVKAKVDKGLSKLSPNSAADCWVSKEDYMEDLKNCLSAYEVVAGVHLDWQPFIAELLRQQAMETEGRVPALEDSAPMREACEHYYTPELAEIVLISDRRLFQAFGYDTCCGAPDNRRPSEI